MGVEDEGWGVEEVGVVEGFGGEIVCEEEGGFGEVGEGLELFGWGCGEGVKGVEGCGGGGEVEEGGDGEGC